MIHITPSKTAKRKKTTPTRSATWSIWQFFTNRNQWWITMSAGVHLHFSHPLSSHRSLWHIIREIPTDQNSSQWPLLTKVKSLCQWFVETVGWTTDLNFHRQHIIWHELSCVSLTDSSQSDPASVFLKKMPLITKPNISPPHMNCCKASSTQMYDDAGSL
jgi:hypothetical protein